MSILDRLASGVIVESVEGTARVGKELAATLPPEAIITLEGDLGAGKTTFVKGLAAAMGIQETVTSPTFNIYRIYEGPPRLIHMDAYRLEKSENALEELMIEEYLEPPFCWAIEWPQRLARLEWAVTHSLEFQLNEGTDRKIFLR